MSTVTPYDSYQQVFALSMLSNRAAAFTGPASSLQQQLLYALSPYLTMPNWVTPVANMTPAFYTAPMPDAVTQIGSWTLEWGPAIFQAPPSPDRLQVADNAVFVASNSNFAWPDGSTRKVYVVATAATNPASLYDWEDEDGIIEPVVNFANYNKPGYSICFNPSQPIKTADKIFIGLNPKNAYISYATATGVQNLLQLTANVNKTTLTLQQFLAGIAPSTSNGLIFTGHSLAGALSPTLALYLQSQLTNFTVSTNQQQNQILVYPTAGATPGDGNFSGFFNTTFVQQGACTGYQYWNTDMWNQYDVVPHAWTLQANTSKSNYLDAIKTLYGAAPTDIVGMVDAAEAASKLSCIAYTPIQNAMLAGSLQPCTDLVAPNPSPVLPAPPLLGWNAVPGVPIPAAGSANWGDRAFLLQLGVQHIGIYSGIPWIIYFREGASTPSLQEPVPGLILTNMITALPQKLGTVSGLTPLTGEEILDDIINWIATWIANHLPTQTPAAAVTAS